MGSVIMAPAEVHLVVSRGKLRLTSDPERHSCRPSVDTLFESVARELGRYAIACLLTGMGKDGALGMLAARQAGAFTIAQNEASSVVFGMPGEAVRLGAAERVLPLEQIAPTLVELAPAAAGRRP
jgi:two-component system chemotaxis response regulator CheB